MLTIAGVWLAGTSTRTVIHNSSPPIAATIQSSPRFSSAYTNLTKCGSGLTKAEEKEAEEHGSDIPTRCKGLAGYDVYIYYSACTSEFSLEQGEQRIPLATQAVSWTQKVVEWRLANEKPFAIIMRAYDYAGNDQCATGGRVTAESLIVKGLKGYEQIEGKIDAKTPNANLKARELADAGYGKKAL
jgi:hypothetical protein